MEWYLGQEETRNYDKILGVIIEKSCLARGHPLFVEVKFVLVIKMVRFIVKALDVFPPVAGE